MFKKIVILQAAGIGDILFCQKIATLLKASYDVPIYWPIADSIFWLKDYIESDAEFVSSNTMFDLNDSDIKFISIQDASHHYNNEPIMKSKYLSLNMDWDNWQDYIKITRNPSKEQFLYDTLLNRNSPYIYINDIFSTPPDTLRSSYVDINTNMQKIEHQIIDDYTMFDWIAVAEKATEIHTVSTCNFYIFEALKIKLPPIHIYNRNSPSDLRQLDFLKETLRQEWIFH